MLCLAHGANDVANTVSPFALIFTTIGDQKQIDTATKREEEKQWAMIGGIICSVGLVFGVIILGTRVLQTLGKGILPLTLSSGFAAQLSCANVTIVGTYLSIPLSTTNLIVISILAIGVVDSKIYAKRSPHPF